MISPGRLFDLCEAVKFAVITYYTAEDVPLPERRYVAAGDQQVAFDCAQFTVAPQVVQPRGGQLLAQENSAMRRDPAHMMRGALIGLTLVRCDAPMMGDDGSGVPAPPPVAEEEAFARLILADGQLMLNGLNVAQGQGNLVGCAGVAFIGSTTPGISGGLGSTKLVVLLGME